MTRTPEEVAGDNEETASEVVGNETWETSNDEGDENDLLLSPNGSDHEPSDTDPDSPTDAKRLYSEHITNTPSASPKKKQNRLQATSSIRNALEIASEPTYGSPKGLLRFWKRGSQAQVKEYWDRELETIRAAEDDEAHSTAVKKSKSAAHKREAAKLRKKRQREREKDAEIRAGVRSPEGTKRKVSAKINI
jgi:hypothetical protein